MSQGCLVVFALPFAAVGVVMAFWLFSTLGHCIAARSWVETPARILEAHLAVSHGSKGSTYRAEARYAYTFGGKTFENTKVKLKQLYEHWEEAVELN